MAYTFLEGSSSIGTSEFSLVNGSTSLATSTTVGTVQLFLDLNALTATEQYTLKISEKVQSGGTKRVVRTLVLRGVQPEANMVDAAMILGNGWDITLTKNLGTDRTIVWSIRIAS